MVNVNDVNVTVTVKCLSVSQSVSQSVVSVRNVDGNGDWDGASDGDIGSVALSTDTDEIEK